MSPALDARARLAWLHVAGGHGATRCAVVVVGETPTRYRVRADGARVRLARRWLEPGDPPALVPKAVVTGRCWLLALQGRGHGDRGRRDYTWHAPC